jgi:hypothetical protein
VDHYTSEAIHPSTILSGMEITVAEGTVVLISSPLLLLFVFTISRCHNAYLKFHPVENPYAYAYSNFAIITKRT